MVGRRFRLDEHNSNPHNGRGVLSRYLPVGKVYVQEAIYAFEVWKACCIVSLACLDEAGLSRSSGGGVRRARRWCCCVLLSMFTIDIRVRVTENLAPQDALTRASCEQCLHVTTTA